ncbi:MAG: GntR family transcriptional regulator, partial [Nocardioides sp.]
MKVREYVRALVAGSIPGSAAPSERELVNLFGVARMTVRQAMDALVVEGLLERIPGRGTFVARPRRAPTPVLSFSEDMRRRGMLPESVTLLARLEQAGPGVARALGLTPGDAVIHWRRLRRADAMPMCIEDAYLNEILLPGFLQAGMPVSLYDELSDRGLRPTGAEDKVTAELATEEEAVHLAVDAGPPVLRP